MSQWQEAWRIPVNEPFLSRELGPWEHGLKILQYLRLPPGHGESSLNFFFFFLTKLFFIRKNSYECYKYYPWRAHGFPLHVIMYLLITIMITGLPRWYSGEESACQRRRRKRCGFDPLVRKNPCSWTWQPTPVPGNFHGQRNLVS